MKFPAANLSWRMCGVRWLLAGRRLTQALPGLISTLSAADVPSASRRLGVKALRRTLGFWVLEELIFCAGQKTELPHYYFSVCAREIKEEGHCLRAVLNVLIQTCVLPLCREREVRN